VWNEILVWAWRVAILVFLWIIWQELKREFSHTLEVSRTTRSPIIFDLILGELEKIKEAIKAGRGDRLLFHGDEERKAEMQEIIDRLKKQKTELHKRAAEVEAETTKTDYDKGWDDGSRWAREAHYQDLKRVAEDSPGPPGSGWAVDIETMYRGIIKDFAPGEERGVGDVMAWARGWRNAIRDFWGKVQDKL
jgi:hypothetical protein